MKPISEITVKSAVKSVSRWGAIAAIATLSFTPSAFAQRQVLERSPQNAVLIEAPERECETRGRAPARLPDNRQPIQVVREGGEGIDDPWTWFCLVNFPPEELADC